MNMPRTDPDMLAYKSSCNIVAKTSFYYDNTLFFTDNDVLVQRIKVCCPEEKPQ